MNESERKRIINKGRLQGFLVTFAVMMVLFVLLGGLLAVLLIGSGSFNSSLIYGKPSDSVIDKYSQQKLDTLQSIIEQYYLTDYTREDLERLYETIRRKTESTIRVRPSSEPRMRKGASRAFQKGRPGKSSRRR